MGDAVTLKQNADFRRLYRRGKSFAHPALVVYFGKNRAGICRVGITVSTKIGGAVERNRCKRVIRAAYRAVLPELPAGYDFVFVARTRTKHLKSTQVEEAMRFLLRKAGLLCR